jgi:hypothetical protein
MATISIQDFYSKKFETESTKILLETPSLFSAEAMEGYIYNLMQYSLDEYIHYLHSNPNECEITSKDITQLSSIEDSTINMCRVMLSRANCGLSFPEIASELHADDSYKDNLVALMKYGENQVKTASQLGLCVSWNELWYLSSVGYVFLNLPENVQNKYLSINLLRDPFYSKVIESLCQKDTCLKDYMEILSESTQKRRASSCKRVMEFFYRQCKEEDVKIYNIIK